LQTGQIVFSKAGRDKGNAFVIIGLEIGRDGFEYAYLVDGALRKQNAPKKKKVKHLQPTNNIAKNIKHAIEAGQHIKDADFKAVLKWLDADKEVITHG